MGSSMVTEGLEPVTDTSNPWFIETRNLNGPIKPWCPTWECSRNNVFLMLHSARASCPLNIWKTYWNDPNKPSRTCLIEQTLGTGLVITSKGQGPVPDSSPVSDWQSMGTRTQIRLIRPCHIEKGCSSNDVLTTLHSADNGRPLDTWIPYKGGPGEALNKHALAIGIGIESVSW